ncbi:MAG: ribosome maturation factor RimP [Clostridia bacterium]|nr:ribosome maturation factor RimP [Clostridia bacterium]
MAGSTADRVRSLAEPIAAELNLRIWDVRYVKEGASWFLRIFIDSDEGITIDDCENFSRAIDAPLDEADMISESYYLEVSSPGLGRELTRPEHFEILKGEEIKVRLIRPKDGQKEFEGILQSFENDTVSILSGTEVLSFTKAEISKVRLNDDKDI